MSDPLFQPFRALGYITDATPFAVNRRGKETWVTLSVGKSWQIYNCAKLRLVIVGPQFRSNITALAAKGEYTFAAAGRDITVCKRAHQVHTWTGHTSSIIQLMLFGDFLLSLGADKRLAVWKLDMSSDEAVKVIQLDASFAPTCLAHPPTYINKVLIGAEDGRMQLWNVNTGTMLYEFAGWGSPIRCLEPSPALDVVGIGLADGSAIVHNIKYDELVLKFKNASGVGARNDTLLASGQGLPGSTAGGACTAISFRTGSGPPLMAAGGGAGAITVWHLGERKLHTVLKDAHDGVLSRLHFFPNEPVLMSAAADNTVKHWIFDNEDGSARLLRFRAGHAAPPRFVRHYGDDGTTLLSAAEDQAVRLFSVIQDQQSRELSQVHTKKRAKRLRVLESDLKLPPAVGIAATTTRERDWANLLTAHSGDPTAYTWQVAKYKLADAEFALPPKERLDGSMPVQVTAVCVSQCGNFGFVGTAAGRVDRYNMQSGIYRGQYVRPPLAGSDVKRKAHDSVVVGVGADSCNRHLVTVDHAGMVRTWHFKTGAMNHELDMEIQVSRLAAHAQSMLAAVACADLVVRVFDVEQGKMVRQFRGHTDRLNDVCISSDSRWVLSSSMDGTVRVWDIPASCCLQSMRLGCPVTSLSLSPNMEMLATAHVNRRGIYLWSNQTLFGQGGGVMPSTTTVDVRLPNVATGHQAGGVDDSEGAEVLGWDSEMDQESEDDAESAQTQVGADSGDEEAEEMGRSQPYSACDAAGAPLPLQAHLVTLSGQPVSHWESLVHLDTIKARNKPKAAAQKPEAAPFFLPSVPSLQGPQLVGDGAAAEAARSRAFDPFSDAPLAMETGSEGPTASTQVVHADPRQRHASPLVRLIRSGADSGDYTSATEWFRAASPVNIERELQAMVLVEPYEQEDLQDVALLLGYVVSQLKTACNFDLMQGLLALILKVHADSVAEEPILQRLAKEIHKHLSESWARVDDDVHALQCMVAFFAQMQF